MSFLLFSPNQLFNSICQEFMAELCGEEQHIPGPDEKCLTESVSLFVPTIFVATGKIKF